MDYLALIEDEQQAITKPKRPAFRENDLFGGHVSTSKLRESLEMLSAKGRISCREEKTSTRTKKEWFFVK